jgi:hypothetical protein
LPQSGAGEQVVVVGQDEVAQEQVAHRASEVGIVDALVLLGLALFHQVADRLGSFLVHGRPAGRPALNRQPCCRQPIC